MRGKRRRMRKRKMRGEENKSEDDYEQGHEVEEAEYTHVERKNGGKYV